MSPVEQAQPCPQPSESQPPPLAVVIPAWNERANIEVLIPRLNEVCAEIRVPVEIIVADANSADGTAAAAESLGARVVQQVERGYGGALIAGFASARAAHVVTMDADLSHPPEFVASFWSARHDADVLIASRYVPGGGAEMDGFRYVLSRILNLTFAAVLRLSLKDLSSGFRMYRREALADLRPVARDFDVLQELITRIYVRGWKIRELPFHYRPRVAGESHARIWRFGKAYARTLSRMIRLRLTQKMQVSPR